MQQFEAHFLHNNSVEAWNSDQEWNREAWWLPHYGYARKAEAALINMPASDKLTRVSAIMHY